MTGRYSDLMTKKEMSFPKGRSGGQAAYFENPHQNRLTLGYLPYLQAYFCLAPVHVPDSYLHLAKIAGPCPDRNDYDILTFGS